MMELRQLSVSVSTRGMKSVLLNHQASEVWLYSWLKIFQTSFVWKEDSRSRPGLKPWVLKFSTQMIPWLQITDIWEKNKVKPMFLSLKKKGRKFCQVLSGHSSSIPMLWRLCICWKNSLYATKLLFCWPSENPENVVKLRELWLHTVEWSGNPNCSCSALAICDQGMIWNGMQEVLIAKRAEPAGHRSARTEGLQCCLVAIH